MSEAHNDSWYQRTADTTEDTYHIRSVPDPLPPGALRENDPSTVSDNTGAEVVPITGRVGASASLQSEIARTGIAAMSDADIVAYHRQRNTHRISSFPSALVVSGIIYR